VLVEAPLLKVVTLYFQQSHQLVAVTVALRVVQVVVVE
jgi:hypothetical protein